MPQGDTLNQFTLNKALNQFIFAKACNQVIMAEALGVTTVLNATNSVPTFLDSVADLEDAGTVGECKMRIISARHRPTSGLMV